MTSTNALGNPQDSGLVYHETEEDVWDPLCAAVLAITDSREMGLRNYVFVNNLHITLCGLENPIRTIARNWNYLADKYHRVFSDGHKITERGESWKVEGRKILWSLGNIQVHLPSLDWQVADSSYRAEWMRTRDDFLEDTRKTLLGVLEEQKRLYETIPTDKR